MKVCKVNYTRPEGRGIIPMLRLNSSEIADASASSHEMYGWFTSAKASLPYRLWLYSKLQSFGDCKFALTHETVSLHQWRVPLGLKELKDLQIYKLYEVT